GSVMLLVGLLVAAWLAVGVFQARSLLRREITSYFLSPIAYALLFVFLVGTSLLFFRPALNGLTDTGPFGIESPMREMYGNLYFWLLFAFVPPILTMRLFAEEQATGRLETLMTAPVTDWQIVLGKYLGCLAFFVVLWLPTLLYLPALMGAQTPVVHFTLTPWAVIFVAGLAAALVGLCALALPETAGWRVAFVLPLVALAVAAGVFLAYLGYLAYATPDADLGAFATV